MSRVMEENKQSFTTDDSLASMTREGLMSENTVAGGQANLNNMFSPFAPIFQPRGDYQNLQEPRPGDVAPAAPQIDDEMLLNFRNSNSDMMFDTVDQHQNSFFMGGGQRPDSVTSNIWGEASGANASATSSSRHDDTIDTFDFLAKSISSANNYVSMLTREQLAVLRSFRPSLLYEFLQEIARLRGERRLRRAAPNECAFCKNNGENEECYSSHALKDWRGRVLCPVLRAFRCPRCGATGDRAHTIKYCPEPPENNVETSGNFGRRRAPLSSSVLFGQTAPSSPSAPTSPSTFSHSSIWNNFHIN